MSTTELAWFKSSYSGDDSGDYIRIGPLPPSSTSATPGTHRSSTRPSPSTRAELLAFAWRANGARAGPWGPRCWTAELPEAGAARPLRQRALSATRELGTSRRMIVLRAEHGHPRGVRHHVAQAATPTQVQHLPLRPPGPSAISSSSAAPTTSPSSAGPEPSARADVAGDQAEQVFRHGVLLRGSAPWRPRSRAAPPAPAPGVRAPASVSRMATERSSSARRSRRSRPLASSRLSSGDSVLDSSCSARPDHVRRSSPAPRAPA